MATRLLTNKMLRNLEEMVEAVEYVYNRLSDDRKKVIELKYWNKDRKLKAVAMHGNEISLCINCAFETYFKYIMIMWIR